MKLLVTGFPKFDNYAENSTQTLIESMAADAPPELGGGLAEVALEIVPFENDDAATQQRTMLDSLHDLLERHAPDICLFCGQAASRPWVELETIAINVFKGAAIDPDGPPAYWATLPDIEGLAKTLRDAGIPARRSHHAGTHLCNHILYSTLHHAHTTGSTMRCGFLHLPMTNTQAIAADENRPFVPLSMTKQALTIAIRHIVEHVTAEG